MKFLSLTILACMLIPAAFASHYDIFTSVNLRELAGVKSVSPLWEVVATFVNGTVVLQDPDNASSRKTVDVSSLVRPYGCNATSNGPFCVGDNVLICLGPDNVDCFAKASQVIPAKVVGVYYQDLDDDMPNYHVIVRYTQQGVSTDVELEPSSILHTTGKYEGFQIGETVIDDQGNIGAVMGARFVQDETNQALGYSTEGGNHTFVGISSTSEDYSLVVKYENGTYDDLDPALLAHH